MKELTDLIVATDPVSGARHPVRRDAMIAQLRAGGQARAARLARRLPVRDGVLVAEEIDALQIRVHCELQRLSEELQLPRRIAEPAAAEGLHCRFIAGDALAPGSPGTTA
ncbi:hypothetical protein AB0C29_04085 [Actinoplanes sp. NPDC048791]|uniref:hypothetical protein n=1 Tax=Actinoplanes sp. NPDC048791 TaxID=3154623 RepID=UPI0033E4D594